MTPLKRRIQALEAKPASDGSVGRLRYGALPLEQLRLIASIPIVGDDGPIDLASLTDAQRQAVENIPDDAWIYDEGDDDGDHS